MSSGGTTHRSRWGVSELLLKYPDLSIRPGRGEGLRIVGDLEFRAVAVGDEVHDLFSIEMEVPNDFPASPPVVRETGGRIPRTFHTNLDRSLCLGSPLRLRMVLSKTPTLTGFVEGAVVPYLFGHVIAARTGELPFGELAHGDHGLLEDYQALLGTTDATECAALVELLAVKKRLANKRPCPCGSGKRVGRCHHGALNRLRSFGSRSWFRREASNLRRFVSQRAARRLGESASRRVSIMPSAGWSNVRRDAVTDDRDGDPAVAGCAAG